jgi:hypothetical protein
MSIRPCQRWYSHHHNTFLTSFKYSESCVQNSKRICCKLCSKYAANLLPYQRWHSSELPANLAQGQQPRGHPGKAPASPCVHCQLRAQEGIPESRTFTYRPACCLTKWPVAQWGRPFTKQCNLTYAGQWAGRIANRSIG